jgi:ribose transport system permease protein
MSDDSINAVVAASHDGLEDPVEEIGGTKPTARQGRSHFASIEELLERVGLGLLLGIVFAAFAFTPSIGSVFVGAENMRNMLTGYVAIALVGVAMILPGLAGQFDFSIAASAGASNIVVAATLGGHGWPLPFAVLAGVLTGAIIGSVVGCLVALLNLNTLIVTLGALTLIGGLENMYTNSQVLIAGIPSSFTLWGIGTWFGVPRLFVLLIIASAIVWYIITQLPFGRNLESIGSNPNAARLAGINVKRTMLISFVVAGVVGGCAGVLLTMSTGDGDPNAGLNLLFPAVAVMFLGSTTIKPGHYNVWGTLIGVYLLSVTVSGFTLLGAASWVESVFNGGALLLAVSLASILNKLRNRRAVRAADRAQDTAFASASASGT